MPTNAQFDYSLIHAAVQKEHPRHHFAGLTNHRGSILKACCANPVCPASGLKLALRFDNDPFSGRVPTARELERYFNPDHDNGGVNLDDELRIKHKEVRALPPPLELTERRFSLINGRGEKHIARLYLGACPDCATVLYAIVDPRKV